MKEKVFNIEVFNKKSTQEKIDYLFRCTLELPTKKFTESPLEFQRRQVEFKSSTDLEDPMAEDMRYLLRLMKKYRITGEDDHLIINEYNILEERDKKINEILKREI
jgi:RNA processing factor Prp31